MVESLLLRLIILKASIATLQGTVNGHGELLAGITGTTVSKLIDEAKADAKAADDKAVAAATAVSILKTTEVKANADAISALDVRVTALDKTDGRIAVIESAATALTARVEALDKEGGRVALIEGRVATNEDRIATLESTITGLSGAMHFRGEVESLEGLTGYAAGDVVTVKGSAQEYVFDGENWKLFGDEGSYALKENVYTKSEVYTKTEVDNLQTAQDTAHAEEISAAEGRAAADAKAKADQALVDAKAYVDAALSWNDMPELDAE